MPKRLFLHALFALGINSAHAQTSNYPTHAQVGSRLTSLAAQHKGTASVSSIGKSRGDRDIWVLTVGKGDAAKKPAVLITAGIDGTHLAGTEIALQMAEKMLASSADSVKKLLDSKTFYFIPSVNPDAQAQYAARPRYERHGNNTSYDEDRDGHLDEDPFEDLNNDGLITMVRVEDPTGTFVVSKDDPRVLVKADPAKGETGKYLYLTEGTDNDKDGVFNEDGPGGVAIDKNFTFDYPIFTTGAGDYAASELETQALLRFLYTHPGIFATLTFGPSNNLSEAPKFDPAKVAKRILTGPLAKDATVMDQVSKLYNARTGLKDAPSMPQARGNFAQTAYFHAGRFSFTTPGWWVPRIETRGDSTRRTPPSGTPNAGGAPSTTPSAPARGGGGRPGGGATGSTPAPAAPATGDEDLRFLKWADREKLTGVYTNWTPVRHPDFPDQKVEVGGLVPFAKLNPPVTYLAEAADKHLLFLAGLSGQMPEVDLVNVKTESLGPGLSRVTATVMNKGLLPTYAEIGDRVRFVQKVKTEVKLSNGQTITSGRRLNLRAALGAGEKEEYSWLITGAGKVTIEAGCPTAGTKSVDVTIR